mmetsp:Transcript_66586/g.111368  ORF Transcript_66586/g.111368 Transcript_66586/m.111368 type:complete len:229 (-) Transcript_66586:390-1076(-)
MHMARTLQRLAQRVPPLGIQDPPGARGGAVHGCERSARRIVELVVQGIDLGWIRGLVAVVAPHVVVVLIPTARRELRESLNAAEGKVGEVRVRELKVGRILRLKLTALVAPAREDLGLAQGRPSRGPQKPRHTLDPMGPTARHGEADMRPPRHATERTLHFIVTHGRRAFPRGEKHRVGGRSRRACVPRRNRVPLRLPLGIEDAENGVPLGQRRMDPAGVYPRDFQGW